MYHPLHTLVWFLRYSYFIKLIQKKFYSQKNEFDISNIFIGKKWYWMSNLSRYACLAIFFVDIKENDDVNISGHPHSTYAQKGRGGVKSNVSSCVKGGRGRGFKVAYVRKEVCTYVCTKQVITLSFIIVYRKV